MLSCPADQTRPRAWAVVRQLRDRQSVDAVDHRELPTRPRSPDALTPPSPQRHQPVLSDPPLIYSVTVYKSGALGRKAGSVVTDIRSGGNSLRQLDNPSMQTPQACRRHQPCRRSMTRSPQKG